MERLRLIGTTADGTSLILALEGAEEGAFEVPVTPDLLEALAGHLASSPEPAGTAALPPDGHVRVLPPEAVAEGERQVARGGLAPGAFERATRLAAGGPELRGVRALLGGEPEVVPGPSRAGRARSLPRNDPDVIPLPGFEPGSQDPEAEADLPEPRRAGAAPPPGKLTTAEIQSLLRAGKSPRVVAKLSGATLDWVRRLDETIQHERMIVVSQLLQSRLARPRLGVAGAPIWDAMLHNLRRRRVPYAERVLEAGWSASRPQGKEWKVRFAYLHRGERRRADFRFDPRSREVEPLNDEAAELAWPPDEPLPSQART